MAILMHPIPSRRYLRHGMLPQLAAFEAVVRLGSATRAAEALCMAQPTLSGHLRKLSEALDVRLFDVQGKRHVPTAAALVLLQAGHEVFATLARCEQELAGLSGRFERTVCDHALDSGVAADSSLSGSGPSQAPKNFEASLVCWLAQAAVGPLQ